MLTAEPQLVPRKPSTKPQPQSEAIHGAEELIASAELIAQKLIEQDELASQLHRTLLEERNALKEAERAEADAHYAGRPADAAIAGAKQRSIQGEIDKIGISIACMRDEMRRLQEQLRSTSSSAVQSIAPVIESLEAEAIERFRSAAQGLVTAARDIQHFRSILDGEGNFFATPRIIDPNDRTAIEPSEREVTDQDALFLRARAVRRTLESRMLQT